MKKSEFPKKVRSESAVVPLYRTTNRFSSPSKAGARKVVRKYPVYILYYSSAKTLSEVLSNGIRDARVQVKTSALRNCYASYRLAVVGNIAQVAEESGNSPEKGIPEATLSSI